MFTVGKQRYVWTVSTGIHSANISFPISSQQKEPDAAAFFQTPTPLWDKTSKQNAFVQQSQFSESQQLSQKLSGYSQLHLGPEIICKSLEEKVMGTTPVSIYNNRQGVTEWLSTTQQEQQQKKGMKQMTNLMGQLSPSGAFGSMDVVTTTTWKNTKYILSKSVREKMKQIKEQCMELAYYHIDNPPNKVLK